MSKSAYKLMFFDAKFYVLFALHSLTVKGPFLQSFLRECSSELSENTHSFVLTSFCPIFWISSLATQNVVHGK